MSESIYPNKVFTVFTERYDEIDYGSGITDAARKKLSDIRPLNAKYKSPSALKSMGPKWRPDARGTLVLGWGVKIKTEGLPRKYFRKGPKRPIPDHQQMYGMSLVSSKFRSLVEKLEPSVHQFVPVTIIEEDNIEASDNYYWFIVGQHIDSVNGNESTLPSRKKLYAKSVNVEYSSAWILPNPLPENFKLVFDRHKIGPAHIWMDSYLLQEKARCSNVFMTACLDANLSGIHCSPTNRHEVA